jgi:hypothetical protein
MKYRTDIACDRCSKTPAERRDQVSEQAIGYTCWSCLMGRKPETAVSTLQPPGATIMLSEGKRGRVAQKSPNLAQ